MPKRKLGKVIVKKGRKPGESDLHIPIAADLLKVDGIPIRDNEVSYYSREFPLESFSVLESASAVWADGEREKHSPEINQLYSEYQAEILPWVEKVIDIGNRKPISPPNAEDLTFQIKEKALSLGYDEVGFAKFDRRYTYQSRKSQVRTDLGNAICLAIEQDYETTQEIPSIEAEKAQGNAYIKQAKLSLGLSEYLLSKGYGAQISGPAWHFGPLIPMFVQAGMGQLGVNGQLLSPYFGSRARLQIIITDAPLKVDKPVDYGMYKFCETCQICFMRCPGKAIQAQRVWFRGVEKNKLIAKRCRPIMARFSGCGICMKVCPIQKYGMKDVMEHYVETGDVLGKGSDDLESYSLGDKGYFPTGKLPSFNKEFFDMPEGREDSAALSDLEKGLNDNKNESMEYEARVWAVFEDRIKKIKERKGLMVDMGMDIDI